MKTCSKGNAPFTLILVALACVGCRSIPNESSLLDMTAKGDRYVVTILDYDRKNKIISLYREFRGAKSVQTSGMDLGGQRRQRDGRIIGGAPLDMSEIHPAKERQKAEFLRYGIEYYHFDGTRWQQIVSPEGFLKRQQTKPASPLKTAD